VYEYNAKLNKVIDGDTIDADIDLGFQTFVKQRIKLYGVDTPQSRSKVATEKEEGIKAKNKLIELLPRDFKVRTVLNKRGKFGRVLGHVYTVDPDGKEVNINETMVKEGYATKYFTEKE
jgi:endonuclease YncB( thermonuclease family)